MARAPRPLLAAAPVLAALVLATQGGAVAQAPSGPGGSALAPGESSARMPEELSAVRFEKKPGSRLPLERTFTDHDGRTVTLSDYFGDAPVIVAPVYYDCPMLCTMSLSGLASSLGAITMTPGVDYRLVVYSIDPTETPEMATRRRETFLADLDLPGAGDAEISFLTGEQGAVDALSESIGFHAVLDEETGDWAHAAGIVLATPDGRVARTLYGLEFPGRPLRLSLVEASEGTLGTAVDQALLFCFQYDPATGKYSAATLRLVRTGGALTLGVLVTIILFWLRREHASGHPGLAS